MPTNDFLSQVIGEAAFNGIRFPVTEASSEYGHDFTIHKVYLGNGGSIEPTGIKEKTGTLSIAFLNDIPGFDDRLFPETYIDFTSAIKENPIGDLSHPTLGTFKALIKEVKEKLSPDNREGIYVDISWVEHNGEAGILLNQIRQTPIDSTSEIETNSSESDSNATILSTQPNLPNSSQSYLTMTDYSSDRLEDLANENLTIQEVSSVFSSWISRINTNLSLPSLTNNSSDPNNQNLPYISALRTSLETLRNSVYSYQNSFYPDLQKTRKYTVTREISVWELANEIYGDSSKASLILQANSINDPLFVPPNTKLVIPPNQII